MNGTGTWQDQFSQGFSSTGGGGSLGIFLIFFAILAAVVGIWYLLSHYRRSQKPAARRTAGSDLPLRTKFVPVPGRINPLQQKIIQEMIDEFRRHEGSAQAVPSSVLEKYSEFFFHQIQRMKTSEKEVEDFINGNFPLEEGYNVELDFPTEGSLHLIKSKVLEISGRNVVVEFHPPLPDFLRKGTRLHLNYNVGKHFLQGSTVINDVRADLGLVLRRPEEVILTGERRYSRLSLPHIPGAILDPQTNFNEAVKVVDLSLEGVRIRLGRPLKKGHIYQLTFGEKGTTRSWNFGPLECVPSQVFLTSSGTHEAGLLFLYLDLSTRSRMVAYMKQRIQEQQETHQAEPSVKE